MKVAVIGMGFVGLTTAAVFASKRIQVYGVDKESSRVDAIRKSAAPFYEPGLDLLLKSSKSRLIPTTDLVKAVSDSQIVFICVGTPMSNDGRVNLGYIEQVSAEIGRALSRLAGYRVICVKSTVPPGTTEKIVIKNIERTSKKKAGIDFGVAMTPEFLKEGSAVEDSQNPHIIVIGSNDKAAGQVVKEFFQSTYGKKAKILETNIASAELIKYANNSFLATKISFINTIANVCNMVEGADVDKVAQAIGADPRIGSQFLVAGPGYGGSCFPKDVAGFIHYCKSIGYDPILLEATDSVNKLQVKTVLNLLKETIGSVKGKRITILGTAFKKNTDDVRESVSIKIAAELSRRQASVRVHDPRALENTRKVLGDKVRYFATVAEAIVDSQCIILLTDWDEYRSINEGMISKYTDQCVVIDTRRMLQVKPVKGVRYVALGRSTT